MKRVLNYFLGFYALNNLVRGGIHAFAPDGGAHSIAGLDLSTNTQTILALFALMGFQQIAQGLFQAYILWRRRDLVRLMLTFQALETALGVYNLYFHRVMPVIVPGEIINAILLLLLIAVLGASIIFKEPSTRPSI